MTSTLTFNIVGIIDLTVVDTELTFRFTISNITLSYYVRDRYILDDTFIIC